MRIWCAPVRRHCSRLSRSSVAPRARRRDWCGRAAYFQPINRAELSTFFGKEIGRDLTGVLRAQDLIASGTRRPQPGAPYTYVTTKAFLSQFELETLRDLPGFEALEDAGLLSKERLLAGDV